MNMRDKSAALVCTKRRCGTEAEIETIEFTYFDSFE
jgi:hypothetical protein